MTESITTGTLIEVASDSKGCTTVPFVDNIQTLRTLNPQALKTGEPIGLYGYFARGDTNLPFYHWNETCAAPDNGGTIIKPDAVADVSPGRWMALYSGVPLASWFGIRGTKASQASDTESFQKALSSCRDVILDRDLVLTHAITLGNNSSITGSGTLKPKLSCGKDLNTPFLIQVKQGSKNTKIENIEIDIHNKRHLRSGASLDGIRVQKGCTNFALINCNIRSTGCTKESTSRGIIINSTGISGIQVKSNAFEKLSDCIYIRNGVSKVTIQDNEFSQWFNRATFFIADMQGPHNVKVLNNTYTNPAKGYINYPIEVGGVNNFLLKNLLVSGNSIMGPNKPWDKDDPSMNNATADQISIHFAEDFIIEHNISTYGGDVGITVSKGSRDGIVRGNITAFCDTDGIFVGNGAQNISVVENICHNNSMNRDGKHRVENLGGIVCKGGARDIYIYGNHCYNKRGPTPATQTYGIIFDKTDSKNIVVKDNQFSRNLKGRIKVIK